MKYLSDYLFGFAVGGFLLFVVLGSLEVCVGMDRKNEQATSVAARYQTIEGRRDTLGDSQ